MSIIIGLTGGIGSGKTTIARYLKSKGIPIYIADIEAKNLYELFYVKENLSKIFGEVILTKSNKIDKKKLAKIVFNNPAELKKLNDFIHPLVKEDFENWLEENQEYPILIKESALLFETNNDKNCDYTITVTAPIKLKISRVMARDKCDEATVLSRMKNQLTDEEKIAKSDFVIENIDLKQAKLQADAIIKTIENLIKN